MKQLGRPPSPRGVFSFEDLGLFPPKEVVVDSCVVIHALNKSEPLHRQCQSFLSRLAEAESTIYFNRLLELELLEITFRIVLKERHAKRWNEVRGDGRALRRASRLFDRMRESWRETLDHLNWADFDLSEVSDWVPDLMREYGLGSYDAVHAATALYVGVKDFATVDARFGDVPEQLLTLYVDSSRVASCRGRRAKHGR